MILDDSHSYLMRGFEIADAKVQFEKSADRSSPNSKQSLPLTSNLSPSFEFPFPIRKFKDDVNKNVQIWWWFLLPNVLRERWTWPFKPFDYGAVLAENFGYFLPLVEETEEAFPGAGPTLKKKFMDRAVSSFLPKVLDRESHYVKNDVKKIIDALLVVDQETIDVRTDDDCHFSPCNALRVLDHVYDNVVMNVDKKNVNKQLTNSPSSLTVLFHYDLGDYIRAGAESDVSVTKNVDDNLDQCYENVEKNVMTNVDDNVHDVPFSPMEMGLEYNHDNVSLGEHAAVKLPNMDQHFHNVQSDLLENLPDVAEDVIAKDLSNLVKHVKDLSRLDQTHFRYNVQNALDPLMPLLLHAKDFLSDSPLNLVVKDSPFGTILTLAEDAKDSSGDALNLAQETVAKDTPGFIPSSTDEKMDVKDLQSDAAFILAEEMVAKILGLDQNGPLDDIPSETTLTLAEDAKDSFGADLTLAQETVAGDIPGLVPSLTDEQMLVKDLPTSTLTLVDAKDMPPASTWILSQQRVEQTILPFSTHGAEIDLRFEATNEKTTAGGPIFPTIAHGA